jgi:peptide-methionine (R)-S-oxide reductase
MLWYFHRQSIMRYHLAWLMGFLALGGAFAVTQQHTARGGLPRSQRIEKSEAEWKKLLTPEQYSVLRQQGTERPFTGKYYNHHEKGTYVCAACRLPLFSSATKFDSGTGWPSFFAPIQQSYVEELPDLSYGMVRTEVRCGRCGGHLGHVFDDGPRWPSGAATDRRSSSLRTDGPGGATGSGADRRSSMRTTDGPRPTGLRYCINSAALIFLKD